MAAAGPLRRQEATYLDGTWGWGKEDPETGEDLYNISSVVRTPMAFEEEAWDKPQHRYTWEQVRAMERAELDYRLDLHSIYGQPWSWFNVDYIRQEHPGAQDPVRVLLEDTQTNDDAVGEEGYGMCSFPPTRRRPTLISALPTPAPLPTPPQTLPPHPCPPHPKPVSRWRRPQQGIHRDRQESR